MNQTPRLLISHAEAFAPLRAAQKEALERMERAEKAVADGERRLHADLTTGRDTATSRRVMHEAKRLLDEATQSALEASQALSFASESAITGEADELARTTNAAIAASISRFTLKEQARGH